MIEPTFAYCYVVFLDIAETHQNFTMGRRRIKDYYALIRCEFANRKGAIENPLYMKRCRISLSKEWAFILGQDMIRNKKVEVSRGGQYVIAPRIDHTVTSQSVIYFGFGDRR